MFIFSSELVLSIRDGFFNLFFYKSFYCNVKKVISSLKYLFLDSMLFSDLILFFDWCDNLVNEIKYLILEKENYKV